MLPAVPAGTALAQYPAVNGIRHLDTNLGKYVQNAEELLHQATVDGGHIELRLNCLRLLIGAALATRAAAPPLPKSPTPDTNETLSAATDEELLAEHRQMTKQ